MTLHIEITRTVAALCVAGMALYLVAFWFFS